MVIKDDPTLMFTNAGMNQFKDIILGNHNPEHQRVSDSQKCLRVSGKHNDLEQVGHDSYHHTMFEMLGNWSFGDYFKKEAIDWAWEYLVDVLKLPKDRLYATVFEGSDSEGISRDNEAAEIWSKHLPASHIINGNRHDNFWEMGDTGPCGPCSEIHIDLRDEAERNLTPGEALVNKDHPLVIEIWNLVFMQYNRLADHSLTSLPNHVIDTGMGFERLCMALQGKKSNYDTDVFTPLIDEISRLSGVKYGHDEKVDIAMRVVADHVRAIAFSIADGQLPSNAKAGYVIRRILRRAVRYAYTFLDQKQAFLYKLINTLTDQLGHAYPELEKQRELIIKVTKEEEDAFLRTLERGLALLDSFIAEARKKGSDTIPGKDAFTLYDTYGFPPDLTELILEEHGMKVEQAGFDSEMKAQKQRARNAAAVTTGDWVEVNSGESEFVGYDTLTAPTKILRYRKLAQKGRDFYQIVLAETPFYAEMGGQVGDKGTLTDTEGRTIAIYDTKRENGVAMHLSLTLPENVEDNFTAQVNKEQRLATEANHTATHLLHAALRQVLGTHVEQRGSFVSPDILRFDFSHYEKVTPEQLREAEHIANEHVREAIALEEHRHVPIAEAKAMGAMALFGEKYGTDVRVVKYGDSIELCGGTHVANTGQIGLIKILNESSIAAGIRRIEAVTGARAEQSVDAMEDTLKSISELFHNVPDILGAVRKSFEESATLRKQAEEFLKERINNLVKECIAEAKDIHGIKVVTLVGIRTPEVAKGVALGVKEKSPEKTAFFGATVDIAGKPLLTVALSQDLIAQGLNAANMARQAAKAIKGGGGGQPGFAQAGGKDREGLSQALESLFDTLN